MADRTPPGLRSALAVPQLVALVNATAPADDLFGARFCDGVLVRHRLVLTAAHCVPGSDYARIDAVIGPDNLCRTGPVHGERIGVAAIRRHPHRDLAALRLARPSSTAPLRLGHGDARWPALAVGWGRAEATGPSPCTRRGVVLVAGPRDQCRSEQQSSLGASICAIPARGQRRNTCIGDSGGPVLERATPGGPRALFVVTALTSWGPGCAVTDVGFYTSTAHVRGWLGQYAR